ncbi:MAG: DnaJ domain-containing protein [Bacteroidales bacterium]|nr:DnaJ domain-containing protein [Bacteroidales bacterium]
MFVDYYEVLDILPDATVECIRAAYKRESLRWHPDKNAGMDTTRQMQMINEAYAILKEPEKRARYDAEYAKFKYSRTEGSGQRYRQTASTAAGSSFDFTYDYDIHDDKVNQDMYEARAYAKKLVDDFMSSLKSSAKDAACGAWKAIKPYLIVVGILMVFGLVFQICTSLASNGRTLAVNDVVYEAVPDGWETYEIKGKYVISAPPTLELHSENDELFKPVDGLTVFQQAGLCKMTEKSKKLYCRIMIQYYDGKPGDFLKKHEHAPLNLQDKKFIEQLVDKELGPQSSLIGHIDYSWKSINGQKYIEANYTRTGVNFDFSIPVKCRLCLFQNGNEMVKIVLAYREKETDLWAEDFQTVLNTFKWLK